ncbi:MAG TPA: histidine phosphatase family protein [Chloroflexota bacterium]|nr:histidine phosphatase family protein [Chloroflexota bacterium]
MGVALVYETHATTTDNENGIATGWLPGRLSEEGRKQAAALGGRRRGDGIAVVFASDLARAIETAEIAFHGSGIPVLLDARLRECNYGRLNGMPVSRLTVERARRIDVPFPDGESYRQVVARTGAFLRDLAASWGGRRVLIVGHSANRWALDHLLHGVPLEDLVDAPFGWREGWEYVLPDGWPGPGAGADGDGHGGRGPA